MCLLILAIINKIMSNKIIKKKTINGQTYELVLEPDRKTFAIYKIKPGGFEVYPMIKSFLDKNEALEYLEKMDN